MFRILLSKSLSSDAFEGGRTPRKPFESCCSSGSITRASAVDEVDLVKAEGEEEKKITPAGQS